MAPIIKKVKSLPELSISWLVSVTVVTLSLVGLFVLILLHPQVILILFTGLFLGIAIKPAVDWMAQRGLPEEVGSVLIFIAFLALFGVFIGFVLPLLAQQTVNLTTAVTEGYSQLRENLLELPNLLLYQIAKILPDNTFLQQPELPQSQDPGLGVSLAGLGMMVGQIFRVGLGVIFVFFLAVNWSVEGDQFLQTALLLSNQKREHLRKTFHHIEHRISRYLIGLGTLSLIVGALALAGYMIIGLPYALILAIFAGIMEAIPVIGPALGAIPALIVALSISPGTAIAVIVVSVLIQVGENIWIFPKVMGASLEVPPFVTLIAMLIFSTLFGFVGAFIAIPATAIVKVLFETIAESSRTQAGDTIGRDRISAVRYEIQELVEDIRSQTRTSEHDTKDELLDLENSLETIAVDLDALLQHKPGGNIE